MAINVQHLKDWLAKPEEAELPESIKARNIAAWLARPDSTVDDVKGLIDTVFPLLKAEDNKAEFIAALMLKPGIVLPMRIMIVDILPSFHGGIKLLVLSIWLSMSNNENDANAIVTPMLHTFQPHAEQLQPKVSVSPDIESIRQMFTNESEQAILIAGWLRNPVHNLSEDIFTKIYPLIQGKMFRAEERTLASFASKPDAPRGEHAKKLMFVLSLNRQNDPENRSVIKEWAENRYKTLDAQDVLDALTLLDKENDKFVLASAWLGIREHQDPLVLLQFLPLLKNPEHQSRLSSGLVSTLRHSFPVKYSISIESLLQIAPYISEGDRSDRIYEWLTVTDNTLNDDEFNQLMDLSAAGKRKDDIVNTWVKDKGKTLTLAQLIKYIPHHEKDSEKSFIKEWMDLPKNKDNLSALVSILSAYPKLFHSYEKRVKIEAAIKNGKEIHEDDAIKTLALFGEPEEKTDVASIFLSKGEFIITTRVFQAILESIGDSAQSIKVKSRFAELWLYRTENKGNFEALDFAIPLLSDVNNAKMDILTWIKESKEKINTETLIKFMSSAKIEDELRCEFFTKWLEEADNSFSADQMLAVLKTFDHKSDNEPNLYESRLILAWIERKNAKYTIDDVLNVLEHMKNKTGQSTLQSRWIHNVVAKKEPLSGSIKSLQELCSANFGNKWKILEMVALWLSNSDNKPTAANITLLLPEFGDDSTKNTLIEMFISAYGGTVDATSLMTMLLFLKSDSYYARDLISAWIRQESDAEKKYKRFTDLIDAKAFGSPYAEAGIKKIIHVFLSNIEGLNKFPDLCKHLYPNSEHMQVTFFKELFPILYMRPQMTLDRANQLMCELTKRLAGAFHETDPCLELLQLGKQYGIKPIDILTIANNRLASKYVSLAQVLDKPLMDALKPAARGKLLVLFGELPQDTKLCALFAYADINRDLEALFTDMVEPEVILGIEQHFRPSASSPYMTDSEHAALTKAFNVDPLPEMGRLCDYLKSKVSPTPSIAQSISNLNYAVKSVNQETSTEIEYKKKFIELLKVMDKDVNDSVKQKAVTEFFDFITGTQQGENQGTKLYMLFNALKQELVYLFSEKNGISNYLGILAGLADGCVANISMKTKMYIYGKLIDPKNENPQDVILYLFLCDHIAYPFFETGDKLGGSAAGEGADVFENLELRALHISVPGLLAGIAAEFYDLSEAPKNFVECKPKIMPAKYIKPLATPEECTQFYDNLYDAYGENDDLTQGLHDSFKQEAKVASDLIVRKAMPELLNTPYLEEFKKDCEKWLSADFEPEANPVAQRSRPK
ncbi:MAG: hypothetical protein ACHQAX_02310 [Gammaproteobacteria bacterium]